MLLGKRPRPPIRRTNSMRGIAVDLGNVETPAPTDLQYPIISDVQAMGGHVMVGPSGYGDHRLMASVSPRYQRRSSGDDIETPPFLRTCGLCKSSLAPGRDIYMYRGDTAFCSLECREQQMKHDERKEKSTEVNSKN